MRQPLFNKGESMLSADLHVHSVYSKRPAEWFLQKLGTRESYTGIQEAYDQAKQKGMTFVTLTDHNSIEGIQRLIEKYPDECFMGVETTTYFPENNCKIHILLFDFTEEQFRQINDIRQNVYELRDYIRTEDIAYSVAHATYNINSRLSIDVIEKLLVLFDCFETLNGSHNPMYNEVWHMVLESLTPGHIHRLAEKHAIEPWGYNSWVKGCTGGSDDHAGVFIGSTYTQAACSSKAEFIRKIREKKTAARGHGHDFKAKAFALYKIVCEFSRERTRKHSNGIWDFFNKIFLGGEPVSWWKRFSIKRMKKSGNARDRILTEFIEESIDITDRGASLPVSEKINRTYNSIARLSDGFFSNIMSSLGKNISEGDTSALVRDVSAMLPCMFLSVPFFSTLKHFFLDRDLVEDLKVQFDLQRHPFEQRILWFSDTINELNGVTGTIKKMMRSAYSTGLPVDCVVCTEKLEKERNLPPNVINLPCVHTFVPEFYESYKLHFPSLLKSLEVIYNENPSKIIISTPGPLGLLGMAAARLLGIPCTGVYHTDLVCVTDLVIGDESVSEAVNMYVRWFYSHVDEILVPTREYMDILDARGYERSKMRLMRRGFEKETPAPDDPSADMIMHTYSVPEGTTLLWAGRVSHDKNIRFLVDIYDRVIQRRKDVNLIIAGDGPSFTELQTLLKPYDRAVLTGRIDQRELFCLYSKADLFVFPSIMDTFGMVILEAQACGLPVLVTDRGGPQELIVRGETGYVLPADDLDAWVEKTVNIIDLKKNHPEQYVEMRDKARQIQDKYGTWHEALLVNAGLTRETGTPEDELVAVH